MSWETIDCSSEDIIVSVIITTYKRADSLKRAIKSVDEQTLEAVEIIIVDDNDADTEYRKNTEKLISSISTKKPLIYLKHERNMNGAAARNTGISCARGRYVAFLDDDDFYYKDKLKKQVELIENLPKEYGGVYSNFDIYRDGKLCEYKFDIRSGNFLEETLACTFQMGSGSNIFIRKNILDELRGFDTSFRRHQDYEFLVRFFEQSKLAGIDESLFGIEQNNSHSNKQDVKKFIETKQMFLAKYKYLIEKMSTKEKKNIYWSHKLQLMKTCIRQKDIRELLYCIFVHL